MIVNNIFKKVKKKQMMKEYPYMNILLKMMTHKFNLNLINKMKIKIMKINKIIKPKELVFLVE